ncbi:hypothetical protein pb186bvf_020484 [Paramecium bursaria]
MKILKNNIFYQVMQDRRGSFSIKLDQYRIKFSIQNKFMKIMNIKEEQLMFPLNNLK